MKKYMDKLKNNIRINKNLFVFLLVIVIIGLISGSIFASILGEEDKKLVLDYLNSFFNGVKGNNLSYHTSLINTLIFTVFFALIIWLLGISVIGFFIILFMLFIKAFILGFTVSSITLAFGLKGLLFSFIYAFPHHVINILIFMLLSAYALILSFKLIQCITAKRPINLKNFMNRYLIILCFSIVSLIITSLYEVYVVPKLLNIILGVIK